MRTLARDLLHVILATLPFAAIGHPTAQVPCPYQAYPVKHYGPVPGSTTCFSNGNGVLHVGLLVPRIEATMLTVLQAWMNVLATTFCQKINNWEFDSYRNNTATAIWTTTDYPYNIASEFFRDAWEFHPPSSVLLQVGVSPGCHTEVALTLYEAECREAFGVVIDDCQTATFDGKLGGQLMLGDYTNLYWVCCISLDIMASG